MKPELFVPFAISNIVLCLAFFTTKTDAQIGDNLNISGYVQGNPVRISAELPEPIGKETWMEYRVQNRLNLRWDATSDLAFHWQMRTRFFGGDLVRDIPGYAEGIDSDDGVVNLSWLMVDQDDWLLHYIPDRLYAEWDRSDWNIRLGRQRVNWGINTVTNPNDLFNIYSFYDFDYPERPGADAIRVQRYLSFGSRIEAAVRPARDPEQSIAAALYSLHTHGYDIQFISGYYRERFTAGAGWAGDFRGAGIKGETMFYTASDEAEANFIFSSSVDYMFQNSLFVVAEALYNHKGGREEFQLMAEELTPDNPSFSEYQVTTQLSYPVHTLINTSLAGMYYPDEEAVFLMPSLTWSVIQDLDLQVLAQLFAGSDDSAFARAGNLVTASLKYNF